jgi:peptidoglycan/LPS O-acetylase OafA/YrhL
MKSPVRPPLPNLTSLRFFAAADVVLFHRGLAIGGYQAVTFFFELSGFILAYVYAGEKPAAPMTANRVQFWRARAARILPAYYFALLIALPWPIYGVLVMGDVSLKTLAIGAPLMLLLQQAWWPPVVMFWNPAAWSLSVEFFFYALFPWLMRSIRFNVGGLVVLSYALVVAIAALRALLPVPEAQQITSTLWKFEQFFPLFHLSQFIFGMALGLFFLFGRPLTPRIHLVMLCLGSISLPIAFATGWQNDAILSVSFGLIIFGAAKARVAMLQWPVLILLGEASYAIYILHGPIGPWQDWVERKLTGTLDPVLSNTAYLAAVICIGIFTFLFIERPLRREILGHREHPDSIHKGGVLRL